MIPHDTLDLVASKPESQPRLIKTHLSFDMLPNDITDENSSIKVRFWKQYIFIFILFIVFSANFSRSYYSYSPEISVSSKGDIQKSC